MQLEVEPRSNFDSPHSKTEEYLVKLRSIASKYGLRATNCDALKLVQNLADIKVSSADIELIRHDVLLLIEWGLFRGGNNYEALKFALAAGEAELIRERAREIIENRECANFDDYRVVALTRDFNAINISMRDYIEGNGGSMTFVNHDIFTTNSIPNNPIADLYYHIQNGLKAHVKKFNIPLRNTPNIPTINAAVELSKNNYDLVIGVLKSGSTLAVPFEVLGDNVRYVEWHRHWTRKPIWRKVGETTDKPTEAKRVLICENDAASGKTLQALQPILDKLNPDEVDICFSGYFPDKSIDIAEGFPFRHIYTTENVNYDNVCKNLLHFRSRLYSVYNSNKLTANTDNDPA